MFYDPAKNDHGLPYNPIKALAAPRPIGWISTVSREGVGNLAPFSFFNMLCYDPPFIMISAGSREDGTRKDTVRNAEETGELVFNMATWDTREQMNETSWIEESGVDELAAAGLTPAPSRLVRPVRVAESPAQLECLYHQTVTLPGYHAQSVHHMIVAKVIGVHIANEFIVDGKVDLLKIRPIARLGYMDYTVLESTFSMRKRTVEENYTPKAASAAAE
jgi:flavin reductase (DIM6/NTAB) family NADH-FMN oxidoreductase RutF